MKNSKHQAPTSRKAPNFNLQTTTHCRQLWYLELGISLVLGGWCLVLLEAGV
jgi:hypothetical protein